MSTVKLPVTHWYHSIWLVLGTFLVVALAVYFGRQWQLGNLPPKPEFPDTVVSTTRVPDGYVVALAPPMVESIEVSHETFMKNFDGTGNLAYTDRWVMSLHYLAFRDGKAYHASTPVSFPDLPPDFSIGARVLDEASGTVVAAVEYTDWRWWNVMCVSAAFWLADIILCYKWAATIIKRYVEIAGLRREQAQAA